MRFQSPLGIELNNIWHLTVCHIWQDTDPRWWFLSWSLCGHLAPPVSGSGLTTGDQTPDVCGQDVTQGLMTNEYQFTGDRWEKGAETPQIVARMFNGKLEITFQLLTVDVVLWVCLSLNLTHSGSRIKVTFSGCCWLRNRNETSKTVGGLKGWRQ